MSFNYGEQLSSSKQGKARHDEAEKRQERLDAAMPLLVGALSDSSKTDFVTNHEPGENKLVVGVNGRAFKIYVEEVR